MQAPSNFEYEHPWMERYPIEKWQEEVLQGLTLQSYSDWACDHWEKDYWENLPESEKEDSFQGTCI